jgi:DNA-3-methyladenine glycosylase II
MDTRIHLATEKLEKSDPVLRQIIDFIGPCTLSPSQDYFESLVKSVIYQQLSNKSAKAIYRKLVKELNNSLNPDKILGLRDAQFKKVGISSQKKTYLIDMSLKAKHGILEFHKIASYNDEEIIQILTAIRGIGRWSAQMFLIFGLNRLNVLPLNDLGLKKSIQKNYSLSKLPDTEEILKLSKKWEPYKSIASWYLWQATNENMNSTNT